VKKSVKAKRLMATLATVTMLISVTACGGSKGGDITGTDSVGGTGVTDSTDVEGSPTVSVTDTAGNPVSPTPTTGTAENHDPDDWRLNTPVNEIAFEDTKIYGTLQVLKGDTYSIDFNMTVTMQLFRRGGEVKVTAFNIITAVIVDGKYFGERDINYRERTARYRPVEVGDFEEVLSHFDGFGDFIPDLSGFTLRETGVKHFREHRNVYYEEFHDAQGEVFRAYFNAQDEMLGMWARRGDNMRSIMYHITADVPASAFELPSDFTVLPKSEGESE
jgi:hypothetical protein